jgi:predicted GNAT superfamily acetyltransferase
VTANARKRGVARGLVDALVVFAEQHGYMDITARVAADLAANAVWEKMGFATVRTQPGGSVRNRTINVRMKLCVARIPSGHKTRVRFCNLGSVAAV